MLLDEEVVVLNRHPTEMDSNEHRHHHHHDNVAFDKLGGLSQFRWGVCHFLSSLKQYQFKISQRLDKSYGCEEAMVS